MFTAYGQDTPPPAAPAGDFFASYPVPSPAPPPAADSVPPAAPPAPAPAAVPALADIFAALHDLVGLAAVKTEFERLRQFARVQALRAEQGLPVQPVPRHAIFYGRPGAGKTTVARLYGQLLRALGVLPRGHLVETDRLGLVGANHSPTTAEKTRTAIARAAGGVLFIDDAQVLYKDDYAVWDAGGEILQLLLEYVQHPQADFALVLGGTPDGMAALVQSHDGMKNVFANHLDFADYTPAELLEIFERLCRHQRYTLSAGARKKLRRLLAARVDEHDPTFGNARYVASLFQTITRNQATRLADKDGALDLLTLETADISPATLPGSRRTARPLGFDVPADLD
jgi:hypothetical protein